MLKYVGDFNKLKDYGFTIVDEYEVKAIRKNKNRRSNTFIHKSKEVLCWRVTDIEDLIKDGLVIKVEQ